MNMNLILKPAVSLQLHTTFKSCQGRCGSQLAAGCERYQPGTKMYSGYYNSYPDDRDVSDISSFHARVYLTAVHLLCLFSAPLAIAA